MLFLTWHSEPSMRVPDKIYSVRIMRASLGPLRARGGGVEKRKDAVKVAEVKKAPKAAPKKAPKKEAPPAPVPKKPGAKKEPPAAKAGVKKEGPEAPAGGESGREAAAAGSGGAGDETGIAVDAAVFPFSYFLSAIERRVSENWYSAVSQGTKGLTCVVFFRLNRDGSVSDVRVEKSSGNGYFDRSAQRAVKSAAPFPPLPGAFADPFLGVHFTFVQKD